MVQKIFTAQIDQLHAMLDFIKKICESIGISNHVLEQIIVATEEVLVNVINYGYPEKVGMIEIICEPLEDPLGIQMTFKDKGKPFDPLKKMPAEIPIESKSSDISIGGHGIRLYKNLMDKIAYNRINDQNILILTKFDKN